MRRNNAKQIRPEDWITADVPRGTFRKWLAGDSGVSREHRHLWLAIAFILGMVAGLAWATIVKAHAHEMAIEALPPPCLRTIQVKHGIERDFGCLNGNWRYGYATQ